MHGKCVVLQRVGRLPIEVGLEDDAARVDARHATLSAAGVREFDEELSALDRIVVSAADRNHNVRGVFLRDSDGFGTHPVVFGISFGLAVRNGKRHQADGNKPLVQGNSCFGKSALFRADAARPKEAVRKEGERSRKKPPESVSVNGSYTFPSNGKDL